MNNFDFNTSNIEKISILNTDLYIIDNFYKYPQNVLKIINSHPCKKWKDWDTHSYNGIHFFDHRHDFYFEESKIYNNFFEDLTGQKVSQPGQIVTNCMTFYDKQFNNYTENYWAPHEDLGYTALIYLNDFNYPGTNFYTRLKEDVWETPEHFEPWRSKEKFEVLHTVESKYNRMVLFDGKTLTHGMAVDSDLFFDKTRINQAVFLR